MTSGERILLRILGIGCLLIIGILLISLGPYRELIGFLVVGLAILAVLVMLTLYIMRILTDLVVKLHEQKLRQERLRPNDVGYYEILLDEAEAPMHQSQQKGQVDFAGERTYRVHQDKLTTTASSDDSSTRSMDTVPTSVAPIASLPATSDDVSTLEMSTEPDSKAPIVSSQDVTKALSLFAIARTTLEEDNRAFVHKVYSVQAGISQSKPENFEGEPFDLSVRTIDEPLPFDILLHTSKNIELFTEWQKHLRYHPRDLEPQLVEFTFRVVAPGLSSLDINFYHERRWLRTIHFEFDAVEQSRPASVSVEG